MKLSRILFFILISASLPASSAGSFKYEDYFTNRTMRIDYHHVWDGGREIASIDRIYREGEWSGSRTTRLDPFNFGKYRIKLYTENGQTVIYSKGFDSYFGEYITTDEAAKGTKKTFHESALVPYPGSKCLFTLERNLPGGRSKLLIKRMVDPSAVNIIDEKPDSNIQVFRIHGDAPPSKALDLVIVAEGYTSNFREKAKSDFKKVAAILYSEEPYKSLRDKINIYGVFKPSESNGTDEPRVGKFRNTVVDTTFNSLGSSRYLLTESNKKLRDITAVVPCDAVMIMVNSARYGGGGIYNSFCTFTIDNEQAPYLILHEFGHSFAGLADEYYSSSVAYNEFYPRGTEPVEPNITALLNPGKIKWKSLLSPGVALPTKWNKSEFDAMNVEFGKIRSMINLRIEDLMKSNAAESEIREARKELEYLMKNKDLENQEFFKKSGLTGIVGAFEGAGYSSEGLYRPMQDCIMFTIGKKPYCIVCEQAVKRMIGTYSD